MKFSKDNGINEGNLQKIIGLFLKNPRQVLTSSLLAEWLNITPRSCNRIIQKLCLTGSFDADTHRALWKKAAPLKHTVLTRLPVFQLFSNNITCCFSHSPSASPASRADPFQRTPSSGL